MTAVLLPNGKQQYLTTAGLPAVGYKIATFDAGTSNPRITWLDALKVAQNTNPVILDARGEASIFWEGAYKVQLQDSTGAVIWTQDNLQSQPNGFTSTLVPATSNTTDLGSLTASWRSGYFATNVFVGQNAYPILDTVSGNLGYYARTQPEITFGAAPVSFSYPPGHIYRYGTNTTPGTTDMTGIINLAANVCRQGGYVLQIPLHETQLVTGSLNVTNCHVLGIGNPWTGPGIQASAAQFDILTLTQVGGFAFLVLENLCVDGGNPTQTAGLAGDTVSLKKTSPDHPYVVSIVNCSFNNNKKRGIYIERGGYTSIFHAHVLGSGLHGIECFGTVSDACTTIRDYGSSQYGACPNGYGIKLTNCISVAFRDSIIEDTWGIQLNGTVNRTISFEGVYQENFTVTNPTGMYINDAGGGSGLSISGGLGFNVGGATLQTPAFTNWVNVYYSGNGGIAQGPIPLGGRVSSNSSGQLTVAATSDVTVGQLTLATGTYRLSGRVQTLVSSGGGTITQLACVITTVAGASGLANSTSSFVEGADQTQSFGVNQDGSVKCFTIVQVTVSTIYYLRAKITLSGTITEAYNGILRAELIE